MLQNKKLFIAVGFSFLVTILFIIGALLKAKVTTLDIYLGAIWVFILAMIISMSLIHHHGVENNDKNKKSHPRSHG